MGLKQLLVCIFLKDICQDPNLKLIEKFPSWSIKANNFVVRKKENDLILKLIVLNFAKKISVWENKL